MKKIRSIIYALLTLLVVVSLASCQKDVNAGGTQVQSLAGEWWVKFDGGSHYYLVSTYNTAANLPTEMWIDDGNNAYSFWDIKGKVSVNAVNKTFSGTNIVNQYYDSQFTITNGKVLTNAATSPGTKTKTDSIYFEITFSDDTPTPVKHIISGYARTRWDADDHY
jgi:hypothetical protein